MISAGRSATRRASASRATPASAPTTLPIAPVSAMPAARRKSKQLTAAEKQAEELQAKLRRKSGSPAPPPPPPPPKNPYIELAIARWGNLRASVEKWRDGVAIERWVADTTLCTFPFVLVILVALVLAWSAAPPPPALQSSPSMGRALVTLNGTAVRRIVAANAVRVGHGVAIGALKSKSVANTAIQKAAPWALRTRNVTGRLAMRAANASKAGAAVAAAAVTTRSAAAATIVGDTASKAAKTVGAWWKEELCARGAGQGCQKVAAE